MAHALLLTISLQRCVHCNWLPHAAVSGARITFPRHSTGGDTDELEEPLLGHDADSRGQSGDHEASRLGESRALVQHSINRLDWEELWRVLWSSCCDSFAGILGEFHAYS